MHDDTFETRLRRFVQDELDKRKKGGQYLQLTYEEFTAHVAEVLAEVPSQVNVKGTAI